MSRLVREKGGELERVCRRHHVRIELFSSAAGAGFHPTSSGLHFINFVIAPLS